LAIFQGFGGLISGFSGPLLRSSPIAREVWTTIFARPGRWIRRSGIEEHDA
jgi:hypothetical protein